MQNWVKNTVYALCLWGVAFVMASCAPNNANLKQSQTPTSYNSKDLAERWRAQYPNYPRDNDTEYYYAPVQPYGVAPYAGYVVPGAPIVPQWQGDLDANYRPYRPYDPRVDNAPPGGYGREENYYPQYLE